MNVTLGAPGNAVAHELGHTMGLPHDDGRYPLTDPQLFTGLMNCGGGVLPIVGQFEPCPGEASWWGIIDFQVSITPAYMWKTYVDSKSWPRPAGFGYTGETP